MIAIDPRQGCCTCISERISELLDGELDDVAAPRVAMHLAMCPACGRVACELARVVSVLHGLSGSREAPWLALGAPHSAA